MIRVQQHQYHSLRNACAWYTRYVWWWECFHLCSGVGSNTLQIRVLGLETCLLLYTFMQASHSCMHTMSLAQVAAMLDTHYQGQAVNLVRAARHSAVQLVNMLTMHCPGFRDHCIYRCGGGLEDRDMHIHMQMRACPQTMHHPHIQPHHPHMQPPTQGSSGLFLQACSDICW